MVENMQREITKRFVIHVGYSCNERCVFCYYRDSLAKGEVEDLTTEQVKKRLRTGRSLGKDEVDLSGGEPTIRKDLIEIIGYAKEIGYKTICIITNGLVASNKEFCKKLKDAGLNDVLFSLHGPNKEMHDYLTSVRGSHDKILQAMDNMAKLGINIRINTVINNLNYRNLDEYFTFVRLYNPKAINLLVFNPVEEAINHKKDSVTVDNYNLIGEKLVEALDKHARHFEKINVRFLPYCLLRGHEDKIRTMWQKIYEREEWDPYLFMRFRKNGLYAYSFAVLGFFVSLFSFSYYRISYTGDKKPYTRFCEMIQTARVFYRNKHVQGCRKCGLKEICPGLARSYVKNCNKTNVQPYTNIKTSEPLYFCGKI